MKPANVNALRVNRSISQCFCQKRNISANDVKVSNQLDCENLIEKGIHESRRHSKFLANPIRIPKENSSITDDFKDNSGLDEKENTRSLNDLSSGVIKHIHKNQKLLLAPPDISNKNTASNRNETFSNISEVSYVQS